jgi:predicted Fe-S protein YdhL (DUF1289 family)
MTTTYTYDSRIVSDLHKEVYGCRPTQGWMQAWNANSEDAKQAIWDYLCEMHEAEIVAQQAREEQAIEAFEARVDSLVGLGAVNRLMAIRWIVQSLELTENDLCYGADYVCYCLGLPYSCAMLFTEAVDELTKKETV